MSTLKFIQRTKELLASRQCNEVLPMGTSLSSSYSHEGKATSNGPLDTTLSSV